MMVATTVPSDEDELEQLGASVDFIVEFCNTVSPVRFLYSLLSEF